MVLALKIWRCNKKCKTCLWFYLVEIEKVVFTQINVTGKKKVREYCFVFLKEIQRSDKQV